MKCSRCGKRIEDEFYRRWLTTANPPDYNFICSYNKSFVFCNKCKEEFDFWLKNKNNINKKNNEKYIKEIAHDILCADSESGSAIVSVLPKKLQELFRYSTFDIPMTMRD